MNKRDKSVCYKWSTVRTVECKYWHHSTSLVRIRPSVYVTCTFSGQWSSLAGWPHPNTQTTSADQSSPQRSAHAQRGQILHQKAFVKLITMKSSTEANKILSFNMLLSYQASIFLAFVFQLFVPNSSWWRFLFRFN